MLMRFRAVASRMNAIAVTLGTGGHKFLCAFQVRSHMHRMTLPDFQVLYLFMRKIVLLLLQILFIGCEQTFDNIIDVVQNNYQVSLVSPTDSITFREDDSLVTIVIIFTSSSEVSDAYCDVFP